MAAEHVISIQISDSTAYFSGACGTSRASFMTKEAAVILGPVEALGSKQFDLEASEAQQSFCFTFKRVLEHTRPNADQLDLMKAGMAAIQAHRP